MSAAVVPVERLTRMGDRFYCGPLRCALTAGACIGRQGQAREGARFRHRAAQQRAGAQYAPCADCSIGRDVAAAVRAGALAAAAQVDAEVCARCGSERTGRSERPETAALCTKCRVIVAGHACNHAPSRSDALVALLTQTGKGSIERGRELAVLGVATRRNNAGGDR